MWQPETGGAQDNIASTSYIIVPVARNKSGAATKKYSNCVQCAHLILFHKDVMKLNFLLQNLIGKLNFLIGKLDIGYSSTMSYGLGRLQLMCSKSAS